MRWRRCMRTRDGSARCANTGSPWRKPHGGLNARTAKGRCLIERNGGEGALAPLPSFHASRRAAGARSEPRCETVATAVARSDIATIRLVAVELPDELAGAEI